MNILNSGFLGFIIIELYLFLLILIIRFIKSKGKGR
jgi:hypothetical protein